MKLSNTQWARWFKWSVIILGLITIILFFNLPPLVYSIIIVLALINIGLCIYEGTKL